MMRPTVRELVAAIAAALESQVEPMVQDQWAASVLRSAVQLLGHVGQRVEAEPRILLEDNTDARRVLGTIAARLENASLPQAMRAAITEALQAPPADWHDLAALSAGNRGLQRAIELILRHREVLQQTADHDRTASELRAYLMRRLAREHDLFFPCFTGAPF